MLEEPLHDIYQKFQIHFYQTVFSRFADREATLTIVETMCVEIIHALGRPTVNEFAKFAGISPPNAAYKVNNLISKGYIRKVQSETDKREYYLEPTEKYYDYYNITTGYVNQVAKRMEQRFSPEEVTRLSRIMRVTSQELMPEIRLPEQATE